MTAISGPTSATVGDRRSKDAHRHLAEILAPSRCRDAADTLARAGPVLADDAFVAALLGPMIDALRADPWFQPPWRPARDRFSIGAIFFQNEVVKLSAAVVSADALSAEPPSRLVLTGRQSIAVYRGGAARLSRWQADPIAEGDGPHGPDRLVARGQLQIRHGSVLPQDGRTDAYRLTEATADITVLTATARMGAAPYLREYDSDGRLLRIASLDDAGSRSAMLLTFLRVSGRSDAGEAFAAAIAAPDHRLRWHAMREWLALDPRAAWPHLLDLSDDPHREVRAAARITLPLVERHLACPA